MQAEPSQHEFREPKELYQSNIERFSDELRRLDGRIRWIVSGRLVTFLAIVACLWAAEQGFGGVGGVFLGLSGVFGLSFLGLIGVHGRLRTYRALTNERVTLNREGVGRLDRDWSAAGTPMAFSSTHAHPYSTDLSLFDTGSATSLIGRPATGPGQKTLADWLLSAANPTEVVRRQRCVQLFAPELELRQRFAAFGRLYRQIDMKGVDRFQTWMEHDQFAGSLGIHRLAGVVIPLATLTLFTAVAEGWITNWYFLIPLVIGTAWTPWLSRKLKGTLTAPLHDSGALRHYGDLFALAAELPTGSALAEELVSAIGEEDGSAAREFRTLKRLIDTADARRSGFHRLIDLVFMLDLNLLVRLESWRRKNSGRVRGWIETLGSLDALMALSNVHFEQPEWAFPISPADQSTISAKALGHPLLGRQACVTNDVEVGPPGTVLLVTGSNMSGKSTLLRAVGLNLVLAQAGAPVCARKFSYPPAELWTVIDITDSLEEGVSYYMAQLLRLRSVLTAAEEATRAGRPFFYMFDEILRGTNSAERQIAARRIIRELNSLGALGIVTTHDLALADSNSISEQTRQVHFREQFVDGPDGEEMTFDYILREGPATSTNALRLMEIVGLPTDRDP